MILVTLRRDKFSPHYKHWQFWSILYIYHRLYQLVLSQLYTTNYDKMFQIYNHLHLDVNQGVKYGNNR